MTQIYAYSEIENAYNILMNVVKRENKLHMMDMTILQFHLDELEDEILPMLEQIAFYDPTP
jgi:hypothetical protein